MDEPLRIETIGVPWYRREHYDRIREIMVDGNNLPASFEAWLRAAEKVLQDVKASGQVPVKAHLDPDQFAGWCAARGLRLNAHARMQFASEVAMALYQKGHG